MSDIMAAIAVFILSVSMSSVTFLMVLWNELSSSGVTPVPFTSSVNPAKRSKKRLQPLMLWLDHGADFSKSPMNISYKRMVSAPYSLMISSGLTTFPRDLDIFSPFSPKIMPCEVRLAYGSGQERTPISYKNFAQKREYKR